MKWLRGVCITIIVFALCGCSSSINSQSEEQASEFVDKNFKEAIYACIDQLKDEGMDEVGLDSIVFIQIDYGELEIEANDQYASVPFEVDKLVSFEDLKLFPNLREIDFDEIYVENASTVFSKNQPIDTVKLSDVTFGEDADSLRLLFTNISPRKIKLFRSGDFDISWVDAEKIEDVFFVMDHLYHPEELKNSSHLVDCYIGVDDPIDLSIFSKHTQLEELMLDNVLGGVYDLEVIKGLVHLERLKLDNAPCKHIELLNQFTELEELSLVSSQLEGHFSLKGLDHLESLNLAYNQIESIDKLPSNAYEEIDLETNLLSNIDCLSDVQSVEYLILNENKIYDWTPLLNMKHIDWLEVGDIDTLDLSKMPALESLETFHISRTELLNADRISLFKNLECLSMYEVGLTELPDLRPLTLLEELDVSGNKITDISTLKELKNLKEVDLSYNPLEGQIEADDYDFEIEWDSYDDI